MRLQEQYRYLYELADYHISSSSQENEMTDDDPLYANSSQLWEPAFNMYYCCNYNNIGRNDDRDSICLCLHEAKRDEIPYRHSMQM